MLDVVRIGSRTGVRARPAITPCVLTLNPGLRYECSALRAQNDAGILVVAIGNGAAVRIQTNPIRKLVHHGMMIENTPEDFSKQGGASAHPVALHRRLLLQNPGGTVQIVYQ